MNKAIGIYQIIGGLLGLVYILTSDIHLSYGLILGGTLFVFSLVCGILLLVENKNGNTFSIVNQLLQVFSISILGVFFVYYNPASLEIGFSKYSGLIFDFHIGSKFIINSTDTGFAQIAMNPIAIFIAYHLYSSRD